MNPAPDSLHAATLALVQQLEGSRYRDRYGHEIELNVAYIRLREVLGLPSDDPRQEPSREPSARSAIGAELA